MEAKITMSKLLQTLSVLESSQLLDELLVDTGTKLEKRNGVRNHCIGLLMLDAGLRVSEVCGLHKTDLTLNDTPHQSVVINADIAKRGRERTVPLSQRLRKAIEEMIVHWWTNAQNQNTFFAFYQWGTLTALRTRQVQRIIRAASIKAIGRPIHPHMLRHTFATRLMRTTNIRIVQELLGHKNLSSTQIYTHPNNLDLKNAIDNLENTDVT